MKKVRGKDEMVTLLSGCFIVFIAAQPFNGWEKPAL